MHLLHSALPALGYLTGYANKPCKLVATLPKLNAHLIHKDGKASVSAGPSILCRFVCKGQHYVQSRR